MMTALAIFLGALALVVVLYFALELRARRRMDTPAGALYFLHMLARVVVSRGRSGDPGELPLNVENWSPSVVRYFNLVFAKACPRMSEERRFDLLPCLQLFINHEVAARLRKDAEPPSWYDLVKQ